MEASLPKDYRHQMTKVTKNCKKYNPALQPNNRFQGSKVAMLSGKVPRFLQGSRIARLQVSRAPRFQSSRLPGFWGSRVQGSKRNVSRLVSVLV